MIIGDNMKKKPNYKMRRMVALIIIILIILVPIIIANRNSISHIPTKIKYREYSNIVNSLYDAKFDNSDVKSIMEILKKRKKVK